MNLRILVAAALFLSLPFASVQAQTAEDFSSLEERMTGREFEQAGLDKLTPAELAALNEWIRDRSLATREASAITALPSQPGTAPEIDRMAREPFQTRIKGSFDGWTGTTVFELENGMAWRQTESDRYRVEPEDSPVVVISPGFGGSWRMSVEGHNRGIRVERIE